MAVPLTGWSAKDPDEVLDYSLDWSDELGSSDTIDTSTWAVQSGDVTLDSDTNTDTTTTVWVSGGTAEASNILKNTITTAGGRTIERTVTLDVIEK